MHSNSSICSNRSLASAGPPTIPATARRVIQDLKEIVCNSDDEIYAMLRECNMDPNETVQRLLNQDTFHEVKRKRDRKKENTHKQTVYSKTRSSSMPDPKVCDQVNDWISQNSFNNSVEPSGGQRMQSSSASGNVMPQRMNVSSTCLSFLAQAKIKVSTKSSTNNTIDECASDLSAVSNSHPKMVNVVGVNGSIFDDNAKLCRAYEAATDSSLITETDLVLELTSTSRSSSDAYISSSPVSIVEPATVDLRNKRLDGSNSAVISSELVSHDDDLKAESYLPLHAKPVDMSASSMPAISISETNAAVEIQAHWDSSSFSAVQNTLANDPRDEKFELMSSQEGCHKLEISTQMTTQNSEVHTIEIDYSEESTILKMASNVYVHKIQEDKPVIIPQHLQVPETMQNQLSFGSFRENSPILLPINTVIEMEKPSHNHDESRRPEAMAESG